MAIMRFFHHIGAFFLFSATVLFIVTCISAPVVNDIPIMRVMLANDTQSHHSSVSFGTFGWCVIDVAAGYGDECSSSRIGYSPADILGDADQQIEFGEYSSDTAKALTRVMILHPIVAGISFIAFVLSLGAGMFGSFMASLTAMLAFVLALVAIVCDFVLFSIVATKVSDADNDAYAYYSYALWTFLAGAILTLLATIILFVTCCSGRIKKRREARRSGVKGETVHESPAGKRRRWWNRRRT